MLVRRLLFLLLLCLASFARSSAAEPVQFDRSQIVGSVYGKAITAGDVGLSAPIDTTLKFDARDRALWDQMGRIMVAFGSPIMERFVKEHKLEVTRDEIAAFKKNSDESTERMVRDWESRLAELNKKLADPALPGSDRTELEKERGTYEKLVKSKREWQDAHATDDIAKTFIMAWKTERELHRAYGGRIIFQQAGPEALDARRRLFEQAEQAGDLKFEDPGVRHMFYYYANMRHVSLGDGQILEKMPWFLGGK